MTKLQHGLSNVRHIALVLHLGAQYGSGVLKNVTCWLNCDVLTQVLWHGGAS